jgi:outer membrane protein G
MKKLALLLAALGVMSATTFAAEPTLKVTSIGQEIELENTTGNEDIGESLFFFNTVNMAYGDWSFGLTAGKAWSLDTDEIEGNNHRVQLSASKNFGNYNLGLRWRTQENYDRYYVTGSYNTGMFFGSADLWYEEVKGEAAGKNDILRGEITPVGVQFGDWKVAYFMDCYKYVGDFESGETKNDLQHQIRFYAPLYKGEKLGLRAEWRLTVHENIDVEGSKEKSSASKIKDFGRSRVYLHASYKATESLDLYGSYYYEFRDDEFVATGKNKDTDEYKGDLVLGWKYKF